MSGRPAYDAVFFDAAGTLFRTRELVGARYRAAVEDRGEPVGRDAADRLQQAFQSVLARQLPLLFPEADDRELPRLERGWWWRIVQATCGEAGLRPPTRRSFDRIYEYYATGAAWRLEPGCRRLLKELRRQGCRVGIISNFDSRLPKILEALELRPLFDTVTVSSLVRAAKPDPAIFRIALEAAGVSADRALHIGDTPREDIRGAVAAGVSALLYDPSGRHAEGPVERIAHLTEALRFLV